MEFTGTARATQNMKANHPHSGANTNGHKHTNGWAALKQVRTNFPRAISPRANSPIGRARFADACWRPLPAWLLRAPHNKFILTERTSFLELLHQSQNLM